ncbi:MAG: serine/threonine protein kinase [Clostridium sp.]|nr:serine/threonine protein kinase [Clostridium sp.]
MTADTVLFGKYRLDHVIGKGRTGTVWLAVHLGLEEYRAIKQVSKAAVEYEAFRREALILKSLRHPAIPIVYDLEEDQNFLYLIQEYIKGESLYALIQNRGVMREAEAVHYGLQICALVKFLHFAGEKPILFLDLQPKNLIICGGVVKIIDFGQAAFSGHCAGQSARYGTVGCAAPEQYTSDQILDTRTDVYAIGAVLSYMVSGKPGMAQGGESGASDGLRAIIRRCMETDREKRFRSAGELQRRLEGLPTAGQYRQNRTEKTIPSLAIAVVGSREGTGATHTALALCGYLKRAGFRAVYEERNVTGHIRRLAEHYGSRADDQGFFRIRGLKLKPWYGGAVSLEEPEAGIVVRDYGTDWQALCAGAQAEPMAVIMVAGAGLWEREDCLRMLEALRPLWDAGRFKSAALIVRNPVGARYFRRGAGGLPPGTRRFAEPVFGDPFCPGAQGGEFLKELWDAIAGGRTGKRSWLKRCLVGRKVFFAAEGKTGARAGPSASSEPGGGQG